MRKNKVMAMEEPVFTGIALQPVRFRRKCFSRDPCEDTGHQTCSV